MTEERASGGLSVRTLLLAGLSSAIAATVVPMIWQPGTVFAAAMTPVVVALVTEALRRPVETVSSVTTRRTRPASRAAAGPRADERFDPLAPPTEEDLAALPATGTGTRTYAAPSPRRGLSPRAWRLALVTGLVAFAGAATVVTAAELVAGDAPSGKRTSLFGGSRSGSDSGSKAGDDQGKDDAERTATPTPSATPTASPSPTPTATPTPTPTPAPEATAAPEVTAPPEAAPEAAPTPTPVP